MDKQPCPPEFIWDSLVKDCIAHDARWEVQLPVTEAMVVTSTVTPVQCWNFAVWISVCFVVVLSSSVLVLLLWVIIYRRHTHGKRNSECPASQHHNINTKSNGKEDSCPHMNGRKQEVSDCEMGWGPGFFKARAAPAVPLPATELGDSALVTTKTVQLVDYSQSG